MPSVKTWRELLWNSVNAKFAFWAFSEVRFKGVPKKFTKKVVINTAIE